MPRLPLRARLGIRALRLRALPYVLLIWLHRHALDARRRDRTWRHLAWSAVAGLTAAVVVALGAVVIRVLWQAGLWWVGLLFASIALLPFVARGLVRHVAAPRGWVRPAFYLGRIGLAGRDAEAVGLCSAAWAFAHAPSPSGEAWLERVRTARAPLGDAEVVATALVAAGRGDADTARLLLRSVPMLVENHPAVRELAGEWLAVDAAERGAWAELAEDARATRWPASPLTYLLEGIAARRTGDPGAPGELALLARWLFAPHRGVTSKLLHVAPVARDAGEPPAQASATATTAATTAGSDDNAAPSPAATTADDTGGVSTEPAASSAKPAASAEPAASSAKPAASAEPAASSAKPAASAPLAAAFSAKPAASAPLAALPHAVAAHLAFRARPPSAGELATAVHAWDIALADAQTHGWLARRALELEAPLGAVDRALREVAGAVTDELARAAEAHQLGAPPSHGPVGDGLARRLRHGRLDALEHGFTRWAQRRHDGSTRAAIDEWREFVALHAAYVAATAAGGIELRRLAFPHAFSTGSNMAAWLWNVRKEYVVSHAISVWLLEEALAVGDAEAIELGHRNTELVVPTRV